MLEQTWRWFGSNDPISLAEIRQTGTTGIVTALHHIPTGEVWSVDEIMKRKRMIEAEGFTWSVVESIPVHESIKKREGEYQKYVQNFKETLRNLGRCGVDIVCYNFMPVLDWSRTDLDVRFDDGSITTKFETKAFAAFDIFLLKRPGAEGDYSANQQRDAKEYVDRLDERLKEKLIETVLLGFPGSEEAYTLDDLRSRLEAYHDISENDLREHLSYFLTEVIPVAQECGISMGVHPDDPPWPLLGLPRIVSNEHDLESLLRVVDAPSNGLTICTGSLGAGTRNDLVAIAERFADRISFVHLRNVRKSGEGDFIEDNHLEGDVDMYGVMKVIVCEQQRREQEGRKDRRMPLRPDHGHLMIPDQHRQGIYPGYSLFGRMRGLAELRGLELGVRRSLEMP